jgi:predicted NAD-dependent protein-ADP-ribosyltransferase YbiA (DUF1768 family)
LNDRPDSTDRCLAAVEGFRRERTEANRRAIRDAYFAIPRHMRRYALGDMDSKDGPLRVLMTPIGERPEGFPGVVTAENHERALEYFAERQESPEQPSILDADGPQESAYSTVTLAQTVYPGGWPDDPGVLVLRNEYPCRIRVNEQVYPTVTHAYWALSTTDPASHDQIRDADTPYLAFQAGRDAPRRPAWPESRLAVMTALIRAKFTQHPKLADALLATGDGRIVYTGFDSLYWIAQGVSGRNWIGRSLELVRSELVASRELGNLLAVS